MFYNSVNVIACEIKKENNVIYIDLFCNSVVNVNMSL